MCITNDNRERYVSVIEENRVQGNFYRAVLNVHRGHYSTARRYIDRACELLDTNLTALVGESYGRAYQSIVRLQQLMELTEVIQYKSGSEEKKALIRRMWTERLKGCKRNVEVWQQILSVRSLVTGPKEDIDTWLEFSSLCRKNGRLHLSLRILTQLVGRNPSELVTRLDTKLPTDYPQMTLSCLKHLYSAGYPKEAFGRLQELVGSEALNTDAKRNDGLSQRTIAELKARCYLKLGAWQLGFMEEVESKSSSESKGGMEMGRTADYHNLIPKVLEYFNAATVCDGQSYKAWHEWAVMNFRVVSHYSTLSTSKGVKGLNVSSHIVPAIQGFFRAILLQRTGDNSRQDVLRLLALWFAHGARKDVEAALVQGINAISLDNWLAVIPQMIARINTPHPSVRKLLHDLLCKIGRAHPQALVYPLTVSSKAQAESRKAASLNVLNNMRIHSAALVDQAMLVSQELVRVAILWHELWHEGIEEASRFWFGQKNAEGMLATLAPLHAMMDKGPQTMREVAFQQGFGRPLQEAQEMTKKYVKSRNVTWLQKAWELYSDVFRKMSKQLLALTDLELHDVSPKLLGSRDLQLAVPGTYRANQPIVRIGHFSPSMRVIESKQHPRKLTISGSDGVEYAFLLKGHEDLRQDERVMQLFGLVNTLLANDRNTAKSDLSIHR
jgi:FKBP12-rapamycin complex-associated protein